MNSGKRRSKVKIAGKTYTIISQKSHQHVQAVGQLVNEQYYQIQSLKSTMTTEDTAILVAVNAVSKQIDLEQEILKLTLKLNQLTQKLSEKENQVDEQIMPIVEQGSLFDKKDDQETPAIFKK